MKKPEKPVVKSRRKKPPKPAKQPVVFFFQPTEYRVVPPAQLAHWEEAMRTRVGFSAEAVNALVAAGGVETETFCPDFDD